MWMKFTGHQQDLWCLHTKTAVILTLSLDICMHTYSVDMGILLRNNDTLVEYTGRATYSAVMTWPREPYVLSVCHVTGM